MVLIRNAVKSDAPFICEIYNYYIKNSVISFEEKLVTVKEIEKRIEDVTLKYPWLVCEEEGVLNGYAYAAKWKGRNSYRYSAECTVYVQKDNLGKGIGNRLMTKLIEEMKVRRFHKLIAGIALPNDASIALIEKLGFKECGLFKEVGFKFGKWIDVGYWEKMI